MSRNTDDRRATGRREALRGASWRPTNPEAPDDDRRNVLRRAAASLSVALAGLLGVGEAAAWEDTKCVDNGCRTYYPCTEYIRTCGPLGCDEWEWNGCCSSC